MVTLSLSFFAYADEGFPGREKFPHIPFITLDDFYQGYKANKFAVVDARSVFEYDVIHIKNATNFSVNDDDFFEKINAFAKKTTKTIVFYCNGRRCMKSYNAADKSKLSNIFVYDAGVFDWSVAHPDEAVLFGES
ncbi:MAG: rhodanese-like domain-containing protein [gamma proteobacterium symbiont of Bathyaustriella thionipta]|nr:rhodanese-like domain-containing protein [gamma proteobacterium symbiont of Bathyaustriella thionipta]